MNTKKIEYQMEFKGTQKQKDERIATLYRILTDECRSPWSPTESHITKRLRTYAKKTLHTNVPDDDYDEIDKYGRIYDVPNFNGKEYVVCMLFRNQHLQKAKNFGDDDKFLENFMMNKEVHDILETIRRVENKKVFIMTNDQYMESPGIEDLDRLIFDKNNLKLFKTWTYILDGSNFKCVYDENKKSHLQEIINECV